MHPPLGHHIAMGVLVLGARIAAPRLPVARCVGLADRAAERLMTFRGADGVTDPGQAAAEAGILAHRVSRIIPGAHCLHRAVAARIWLGARGVRSQLAIGLRKRGGLEGHAWLEIDTPEGSLSLFVDDSDGYSRLWTSGKA